MTVFELDFAGEVALDIGASPVKKVRTMMLGAVSRRLMMAGRKLTFLTLARASKRERDSLLRRYSRLPDSASKAWTLAVLGERVMAEPTAGSTRSLISTVTLRPATSEMICTWEPSGSTSETVPVSPP